MKTFLYKFLDGAEIESGAISSGFMKDLVEQHGECIYNGWAKWLGVGEPGAWSGAIQGGSNTRGDGFKTGFNPALGMNIKSVQHYRDELKARGMHEVGNEKQRQHVKKAKTTFDDNDLREIVQMGADISGQEAEYLKQETPLTSLECVKD